LSPRLEHFKLKIGKLADVRFGSLAVVHDHTTRMAASGRIAAMRIQLLNNLNSVPKRYVPRNFFSGVFRLGVIPGSVRIFGASHI
jgi:hypothetical protein